MAENDDTNARTSSSPQYDDPATHSASFLYFLNHNAATVTNMEPSPEDKPMGRQKRKRTSPEDQAVLEAYYARDAKPDKAARLELVKRVALGEKEVQIWFQNRRQSSRRKSRPLLPHEIAQYQFSRSVTTSDSAGPAVDSGLSSERDGATAGSSAASNGLDHGGTTVQPTQGSSSPHDVQVILQREIESEGPSVQPDPRQHAAPSQLSAPTNSSGQPQHLYLGSSQPGNVLMHVHPNRDAVPRSPRRVRKSTSFVRLSMNSEGVATLVDKDASSPSPPRPKPSIDVFAKSASGSSLPTATQFQTTVPASAPILQRASSGRSRDSRAWEFWCDKECRNELETKANQEKSGSAADAIQLLRSSSGRSILGSLPTKRNSAQPHTTKRLRREARMPLQRSSTSNGRLQGKKLVNANAKSVPKLPGSKSALSVHIPGNTSDKENWSPRSESLVGQESDGAGEALEKAGGMGRRKPNDAQRSDKHRGSIDPENDPEIAAFMNAGRDSDKVSDHEELDCVQGLLSLSQGNWR